MDKNQEIFETAPIPKAVAAMAIPTIISMLVTLVYNMADTFFIGQTNNALMVSAVSLTSPVFTLLTAFGNMFGIGGSTGKYLCLCKRIFDIYCSWMSFYPAFRKPWFYCSKRRCC